MIAEQLSASFTKQESPIQQFPVEKGYYRSKILVTDAFSNPLIAAASPIISILERIQIASSLPDVSILQLDISHEFKAFYSRFHRHHYSDEFHLIANYLLCATTDEIIGKSYLKLYGELKEFTAFTPISNNNLGPEHCFFDVVNYLLSLPEQFLDLIELAYFCLLIGFEGKYHLQSDGRLVLDNLIENLFQTMQKLRTNKKHKLFKNYVLKQNMNKTRITQKNMVMIMGAVLFTLGFISHFFIQYQTETIIHQSLDLSEMI